MKLNKWIAILCAGLLLLCGCGKGEREEAGSTAPESVPGLILYGPGAYDSADTAVVMSTDREMGTITFFNLEVSKSYTLEFDGASTFSDKYGQALSLSQVKPGDIVDITFLKNKKHLTTLALSGESWVNASVSKYSINPYAHSVTIGTDTYKLTDDTKIFSGERQIDLMELNSTDILTFSGIGTSVCSIVVDQGHGYLRLKGDENFIGGWIEVGQNIIHQISEGMLLTVPEGKYDVRISIKGGGGTKQVTISRNQEVTLDISDLVIDEVKYGQVIFTVSPSNAKVYVDAALVDITGAVSLPYGVHQIICVADGYSTVTSYLKVASASASVDIAMEKKPGTSTSESSSSSSESSSSTTGSSSGTESSSASSESSTSSSEADTTASYYRVFIDSPENVEIYVDGNYVGICPVSFKKEPGLHVITLRRTGYEPRSYTVTVDEENKDVTYSFTELTELPAN